MCITRGAAGDDGRRTKDNIVRLSASAKKEEMEGGHAPSICL